MSDSVRPILMTPDEWRRLHTKEFQDHIYGRVWGNITKWFGRGSVLALLAFGGYMYEPVRSQLENVIDTKVTAEGTKVRSELSGRITGEINAQLVREAREIAKTEAVEQIRLGLGATPRCAGSSSKPCA